MPRLTTPILAAATAVAVSLSGIAPVSAATPSVTATTCTITDTPVFDRLGGFSGTVGEFFTALRENIRSDVPRALGEFEQADQLNQRLVDSQGSDSQARREVAEVYVRIDQIMHDAGYKYGEWRLAFPQMIANNRQFNPVKPLTPAQAAAVKANGEGFIAAIDPEGTAKRAEKFTADFRAFRDNASPRLKTVLAYTWPDLEAEAHTLKNESFTGAAADYARAAAGCADKFAAAGITAEPGDFTAAVPDTYIPDLSTLRGISGPRDTAIFEPLKEVALNQGTSSEINSDAWVLVIGVVIAIVAARGPWIMAHLPDFLAHPPQLQLPPPPQINLPPR